MVDSSKTESQYSEREILQEERYLWMARAFSLIALLAFIANILMLIALSGLMPLMRIQPFYLQAQDKDHQVISIVRPNPEDLDLDVLQESLVREYLLARFGIGADVSEVERRWGIDGVVFAMSASSVYETFFKTESSYLLKLARDEGLTRDVRIGWVNRKRRNPDVWEAEIETIDMGPRKEDKETKKWNVKLEVAFQTSRRKMEWAQRLRNPLGFVVTNFERVSLKENENTL